jgi:hypothetical protein
MSNDPQVVGPAWSAPPSPPAPPTVTLHPNLARAAVAYQRICERLARHEIDVVAANREIQALIVRDDEGLAWTINPGDGGWLYWSRAGAWVAADPPTSGLATLTPYDLRNDPAGAAMNPDADLTFRRVEDGTGTNLVGSTRRKARQQRPLKRPRWIYPVLVGVLVAILTFVALARLDGGGHNEEPLAPPPTMPVGS